MPMKIIQHHPRTIATSPEDRFLFIPNGLGFVLAAATWASGIADSVYRRLCAKNRSERLLNQPGDNFSGRKKAALAVYRRTSFCSRGILTSPLGNAVRNRGYSDVVGRLLATTAAVLLAFASAGCMGKEAGNASPPQAETAVSIAQSESSQNPLDTHPAGQPTVPPTPIVTPVPTETPQIIEELSLSKDHGEGQIVVLPTPIFIGPDEDHQYQYEDLLSVMALRESLKATQVAPGTGLLENVQNGTAYMKIISGGVTFDGKTYTRGAYVMFSPVPGHESDLLFFTPEEAIAAVAQGEMEINSEDVDFMFVGAMPAIETSEGNLIRLSPDTGQWETIAVYRADDITIGRNFLEHTESGYQVPMLHGTRINFDELPGYATITARDGSSRMVLKLEEFQELMEQGWQSIDQSQKVAQYLPYTETRQVEFQGITIPITLGHDFHQYTLTYDDDFFKMIAHQFLDACWRRYNIGNANISFEEYLENVRQGKGHIVAPFSTDTSTHAFRIFDPSQGYGFGDIQTNRRMPHMYPSATAIDASREFAFYLTATGQLVAIVEINQTLNAHNSRHSREKYGWNFEQFLAVHEFKATLNTIGIAGWVEYPALRTNRGNMRSVSWYRIERELTAYFQSENPDLTQAEIEQKIADWLAQFENEIERIGFELDKILQSGIEVDWGIRVKRR